MLFPLKRRVRVHAHLMAARGSSSWSSRVSAVLRYSRRLCIADLCSVQCGLHALRCEWDGAQPRSGGIKHGVSECGSYRRACCLARPERWLRWSINEFDIKLGNVRKAHNRIGTPIYACHPRAIELHLFH
jgi:hypothetical protein